MELPQPFLFLTCPFSNLGNFETKNQNEPLCVPHWRSKGVHQGCDCLLQATWSGEESWSFLMGSYHHYTIQMDVFFVWVLFTCWLGPDMKAILGMYIYIYSTHFYFQQEHDQWKNLPWNTCDPGVTNIAQKCFAILWSTQRRNPPRNPVLKAISKLLLGRLAMWGQNIYMLVFWMSVFFEYM